MALSSAELLQLQQSLTQLAKASSNIAAFATQLGSIQSNSTTTIQTETKYRRTVIDDYVSLSETLKNQSKAYKETLKNVQGFTQKLDDVNRRQKAATTALDALNASITAAGVATAEQAQKQSFLSRILTRIEAEREVERNKIASQNERVSEAIINIISDSKDALRYRSEYEKDFYGRQLANEVRSALDTMVSTTGAKFGKQLLEFADIGKLGKFADEQDKVVKSLLENNQTINDSNAEMIQQYLKLGKSLGYTSTEFDNLAAQMDGWTAGTDITLSADSISSLVTATQDIATVINNSNEKLSKTLDRDLGSFGNQFRAYMFENRNGFDKLFDQLLDIRSRNGSLLSGQGRDEAADALREASGTLGREVVPRLASIVKIMASYYTGEYDALTNFVQTNRMTALQLNMTEDQYRQSRADLKSTWNIAAESGQKQLDEFLTSRRRSLEAVYGSEPMLRDKMGGEFYKMITVLGASNSQIDDTIKDFGNLSLTSRMSSVELTELYTGLVNSNENMKLMNSLDEKSRQLRLQELKNTTALVSKLGLSGEAAEQFAKALSTMPSKTESTADLVGQYGSAQVLFSTMNNMAESLGTTLNLTQKDMSELMNLRMISKMAPLTPEQRAQETALTGKYTQAKIDLEKARLAEAERLRSTGGNVAESFGLLLFNTLKNNTEAFEKAADISVMSEPLENQALAMQKYNLTQGKLITSTDQLRRAIERQNGLAVERADDIKFAKDITGVFAEGKRFVEAAQGNMAVNVAEVVGGWYLLTSLGKKIFSKEALKAIVSSAAAAVESIPLPPQGKAVAGILAGLATVGGIAYEVLKSDNKPSEQTETATETPKQPEKPVQVTPASEAERSTSPLPSSQVSAAETANATTILNEQFTKYFSSVDTQNQIMAGFLKRLADNSDVVGKDVKEWHKFYRDIHPITSLLTDDKNQSGDTSKAH